MSISVFDMFTVGIGPSSSHTVGPMRAARLFAEELAQCEKLSVTATVRIDLYGSLGHTGKGHGSDRAVLLGLEGEEPERVDTDSITARIDAIKTSQEVRLLGRHTIRLNPAQHLIFHKRRRLPAHPNGLCFTALTDSEEPLLSRTYYSIGGGFLVSGNAEAGSLVIERPANVPHPFHTGAELLERCGESGLSISTLMLENETTWRSEAEVRTGLLAIWQVMQDCVARGCEREGILPGGLKVRRRAATLYRKLRSEAKTRSDAALVMDWVDLYALAVNEENAAGGRVVTAPTNGAAGIIPAVLHYYIRFCHHNEGDDDGVVRFLLAAGAIGILYKINASISGAEVGCQGEVGVACSMAAAGLTEVMGGTPAQVENAAEIGMEHNLGLTCDPVGGLVQVPCIERNAMGAVKAINASRLALRGDGSHHISLDKVIATMRQTGADMKSKYKETARGGLAVNIIAC